MGHLPREGCFGTCAALVGVDGHCCMAGFVTQSANARLGLLFTRAFTTSTRPMGSLNRCLDNSGRRDKLRLTVAIMPKHYPQRASQPGVTGKAKPGRSGAL